MHPDIGLHRALRVNAPTLCIDITCQHNARLVLHKRCEVHFLYVYMRRIGFVVDVVITAHLRLTALIIRVAVHIYPHRLEVHLGGRQVGTSAYLVRAHMQTATRDQIACQIDAGIAVKRIKRYRHIAYLELCPD